MSDTYELRRCFWSRKFGTNYDSNRAATVLGFAYMDRSKSTPNKMAKKLRKESIRLEEFRSTVKDPLRDTLSAFEQISMTVESLKSSSQALAKQEDKIF